MLFNSPEFLFAFLPVFLIIYFIVASQMKNTVIFGASIIFCLAMSAALGAILVLSVLVNHYLAWMIMAAPGRRKTFVLMIGLAVNVLPLIYYKYIVFLLTVAQDLLTVMGIAFVRPGIDPELPIGISFFTFQAVSYLADVYMGRVRPARRLIDFGMYHSCFPQLIAGPIVRYEEIQAQVHRRYHRLDDVYDGVVQFCFGLAKKAILADPMGVVADRIFGQQAGTLDFASAWVGIVAYSLQIYLDFSAYSDMAIGLGRILGFSYPENFNQPYRSLSVTEFWRRWHMTLSRWFRDYVYAPLGGNRNGKVRMLRNLAAVFFLCGLWHGAAYTFVVWGLYHGMLLIVERLIRGAAWLKPPALIAWTYTQAAVMIGWVFFRAKDMVQAMDYLCAMFGLHGLNLYSPLVTSTLTADKVTYMTVAWLVALIPHDIVTRSEGGRYSFASAHGLASIVVLLLAVVSISLGGFTPFIYFKF